MSHSFLAAANIEKKSKRKNEGKKEIKAAGKHTFWRAQKIKMIVWLGIYLNEQDSINGK